MISTPENAPQTPAAESMRLFYEAVMALDQPEIHTITLESCIGAMKPGGGYDYVEHPVTTEEIYDGS